MAEANLVIFKGPSSDAPAEDWEPVKPYNVPDWVSDPDVLGEMLASGACVSKNDNEWYRVEELPSEEAAED